MPIDTQHDIYLELGDKKIFACSLEWPGWCRSGRDEASAIQALISYAPRYSKIIDATGLVFSIPQTAGEFTVIDRIEGNFATSFGTPNLPIRLDYAPMDPNEVPRFSKILKAAWQAFEHAAEAGKGKQLRKGPRGGGRELSEIIDHVANAEKGYLRHLGCDAIVADETDMYQRLKYIHNEVLDGIQAAALGQLPKQGSHGGKRWPLPYFVRRVAWHVIDHTWEIEDRIM